MLISLKAKFTLLFIFFAGIVGAYAQSAGLSAAEINKLKQLILYDQQAKKEYAKLKNLATGCLSKVPAPADTIFSEGMLANNPKKLKTQASLKDIQNVYALTMVYKLEGNNQYRDKAIEYIMAWARVNKPQGNPINDTKLDAMIEAFDMLKSEMTVTDRATVNNWLTVLGEKEVQRKLSNNNWNSHRIKMIGLAAYALDDKKLQEFAKQALEVQIEKNLNADGSGFDFTERDALHYHVYTLQPLLKLAIVISRSEAKNYYTFTSASGSSIRKSVNFLIPYLTGEKTHAEFVNSKVAFDRARANNNEPNFRTGALFNPEHGLSVLSLASFFDSELTKTQTKPLSSTYLIYVLSIPSF